LPVGALAVALVAAGTLSFEVLLVRVFAIEQFYHFAYMAIGVAMLGFGTSGTLLALVGPVPQQESERWFRYSAVLTAVLLIAAPAAVDRIALDPTQLAWNAAQWPRLAAVYVLLALPFVTGALTVLLGLGLAPERPGAVYGAGFIGSAAGALVATGALWIFDPVRALAVPAVLAAAGAVAASLRVGRRTPALILGATVALVCAALANPPWSLEITPYKGLPQVEAYPGSRRVAERTGPLGWVVGVEAPAFRNAPGLSLGYQGRFPDQLALFVDGALASAAWRFADDSDATAILDWLPTALPYALGPHERVLLLGAGAGTEVWNATAHGAAHVTAVELLPDLVDVGMEFAPPDTSNATVSWHVGDARSFAARAGTTYDLVVIGPSGGPGSSAAGVHALNEDFLHTLEAYVGYLELLNEGGVLAVTRWLAIPPRGSVRLILTAGEALRRIAPDHVADGLIVARSWGTVTVLAKPAGFDTADVRALESWSRERQLDLDWPPGAAGGASEFHTLGEPVLFRAARAASTGLDAATRFAAEYPFEVAPALDAHPYPHHFLRARSLRGFFGGRQGDWLPFAEWGYVTLLATLIQSVALAALLLLLPTVVRTRSAASVRQLLPVLTYFAAIGFAYLAAEIAAIQQLSLLLGHPVYAVVAVLTVLLACSGFGSLWSDRVRAGLGWRAAALLAALLLAASATTLRLTHSFQPAPLALRLMLALTILGPLAVLMGMPFALGLRRLAGKQPARIAWAWAVNGFASVVAAPLAALIAIEAGSPALLLTAAAAYGGAAVVLHRVSPYPPGEARALGTS